jgi:ribA/ribD-fused uncharacterized protein
MENQNIVSFTKVALPFGWLGNMSPYPITYKGKEWRTSEALFQSMRFDDEEIIEAIRSEKSPMGAKMKAKKHKSKMVVEVLSSEDIDNMVLCINLKIGQHLDLKKQLIGTNKAIIVEDVTSRPRGSGLFWGAALTEAGWNGRNVLGKVWMDIRDSIT